MYRKIPRASRPFALRALTAFTLAAAFGSAGAAGLGKLTVLSALGQPLRAEIELTSISRDEADSLAAKLASVQAFKQANVDFNPALMSLRFAVEQRGARQVIRISSSQPVNEPFVGMLVELSSSKGRLVREYTFLLDPPELRQAQLAAASPASVVNLLNPPVQAAVSEKQEIAEKTRPSRRGQKTAPKSKRADDKVAEGGREYHVRKGDTLGSIAAKTKHEGISLDQMLVSIYRANPEAFIGNNMNRLKSGKVMSIPDAAAAGGISQSDARNVIVAQSSDFDQYRSKLAGAVAQAPAQQAEQSTQAAGGKITAKVEEQAGAASKSSDRLKLAKDNASSSDNKPTAVVSTEDKLSQEKSSADAQARIRELEKNITELQGLLELKSKDMTAQQKQADAVGSPAKPADAAAAAVTPAKPKVAVPPPPAPTPPGFFDDLLDNPTMLGGIGAAVLGAFFLIWSKLRRKKQADDMTSRFMSEPMAESPNSLFGTTGGQSVNTNNSVFNSNFSPSAMQVDANEVDPVAEADVYIAYGRESQAIDILKDALRAQPERNAARVKLLEIYASQNDVLSFDALASDLYALTKGEGEDWAYAAKMGASLDPKNPLYTDADVLEGIANQPASLHAFTNPVDALDPDSLSAPSRLGSEDDAADMAHEPALQTVAAEASAAEAATGADATDLPLDIGSADDWLQTKSATDAEQSSQEKSEFDDLLDWPLDPASPEVVQQTSDEIAPAPESMLYDALEFDAIMQTQPVEELEKQMEAVAESEMEFELEEVGDQPIAPVPAEDFTAEWNVTPQQEAALQQEPAPDWASLVTASGGMVSLSETQGFASSLPQIDVQEDTEVQPMAAPMEFDFASINLDLAETDSDSKKSAYGESSINIEMATKLDLAVAYMEIGDKEGARELLEEVVKGGSDEQVAKARETLDSLK